jgi:hypothetical protein
MERQTRARARALPIFFYAASLAALEPLAPGLAIHLDGWLEFATRPADGVRATAWVRRYPTCGDRKLRTPGELDTFLRILETRFS